MEFSDADSTASLEEIAKEYEEIFSEIQNYEISDKALDKIEEVLDENLSLKQENLQMLKQIEDLQTSIQAQNFRSVFTGLKTRQNTLISELASISSAPHPPPPIPPPTPASTQLTKPKYRILFWEKLKGGPNSIFDCSQSVKIRPSSIDKFPFSATKPLPTQGSEPKTRVLDYTREIVISSSIRSFGQSFESVLQKIQNSSKDFFDDPDKVKTLVRVLPTPEEISILSQMITKNASLTQSENFLFKLSQIIHLKPLLKFAQFKLNFAETLSDLTICFKNWQNLCLKLKQNKRLQFFFQILLQFGNSLNENHPKFGQASGFKLKILNSLSGIKSSLDGSSLLEALIEEFFFLTGNPHVFHKSEHLLLKELANSSFSSLLESYNKFFQEFCKFSSQEFSEACQKYTKDFVKTRNRDVEELFGLMNETKLEIKSLHEYFLEDEEVDEEGKFLLLVELSAFYDKFLETVGKKWAGVSNRDSRRFTFVNEKKNKCK